MVERDREIIKSLEKFRVLDRDQLVRMHFAGLKQPITQANQVLLRLRRLGHIDCSKEYRRYLYFPIKGIKKDSAKIKHFQAIADLYLDMMKHDKPRVFDVEPKLGDKGLVEPDAFAIWKGTPFYIEIQRNKYTQKQMGDKIKRYEAWFYGEQWKQEPWQPKDKPPIFPRVWILTETPYSVVTPFKVIQSKTVDEFVGPQAK